MTNLYTNLSDSREVAPVMERLGIEADAEWYKCYADDTWKLIQIDSYGGFMLLGDEAVINSYAFWSAQDKVTEFLPAFRLDKLLLACKMLGDDSFYQAGAIKEACQKLLELDNAKDS